MQEIPETHQAQESHHRSFYGGSWLFKSNDSRVESVQSRSLPDVTLRGLQAVLVWNLHRMRAFSSTLANLLKGHFSKPFSAQWDHQIYQVTCSNFYFATSPASPEYSGDNEVTSARRERWSCCLFGTWGEYCVVIDQQQSCQFCVSDNLSVRCHNSSPGWLEELFRSDLQKYPGRAGRRRWKACWQCQRCWQGPEVLPARLRSEKIAWHLRKSQFHLRSHSTQTVSCEISCQQTKFYLEIKLAD